MTTKDDLANFVYRELCRGKSPDQITVEMADGGWGSYKTHAEFGSYKFEYSYALETGFAKFKKAYPDRAAKWETQAHSKKLAKGLAAALLFLLILYVLNNGGFEVLLRMAKALVTGGR